MIRTYLNLANGIESEDFRIGYDGFVRIQSSLVEAKKWDRILLDLDYNFLMDLALGREVVVVDGSPSRRASKALRQGIPWIKFVLYYRWMEMFVTPYVDKHNVSGYFIDQYRKLTPQTKKKLDYVKKFFCGNGIGLYGRAFRAEHDGDYEWHRKELAAA